MDDSLKKFEAQLEKLTPTGMSDEAEARFENLIDELVATPVSRSPIGWSWQVTSAAAAVVLLIGMTSGWWLGQFREAPPVSGVEQSPEYLASAFDLIEKRSWMQPDGNPELYLSLNGEVRERRTEIDISEETVLHRDSGKLVKVRVITRQPINEPTNQF